MPRLHPREWKCSSNTSKQGRTGKVGELENVKSIVKSDSEIVKLSVNVFSQATTDETTTFCLEPLQNFIKVLIKSS